MNKTINDMVREVEEGEGEKVYTVWIGGVEATDYLVTLKKAEDIKYGGYSGTSRGRGSCVDLPRLWI